MPRGLALNMPLRGLPWSFIFGVGKLRPSEALSWVGQRCQGNISHFSLHPQGLDYHACHPPLDALLQVKSIEQGN